MSLSKGRRIFLVAGIFLLLSFFLSGIVYAFNLDGYIFPSSVVGYVYNKDGQPLENVKVCIETQCNVTESTGSYVLGDLRVGKKTLEVSSTDYKTVVSEIDIKRGRNQFDFILEPRGYGKVKGQCVSELKTYDYSTLQVIFTDQNISLDEKGEFEIKDVPVGNYTLKIISPDFTDREINVRVEEAGYDFGKIELTVAGDYSAKVVDFLSLNPLEGVLVKYEKGEVQTTSDGVLLIKDMPVDENLSFSLTKEGYLQKQFDVVIKQGKTSGNDIELVREGKTVYVSNRMGNENIYIAHYDGSEEKLLSDNKGDNYDPFLTDDGKTVRFLSTRDHIKSSQGGNIIPLVYSVSSSGEAVQKISKTNYEDYGDIGSFDFQSMKRLYLQSVYDNTTNNYKYELYFGNIDGTDTKKVYEYSQGYIPAYINANNGDFIVFAINSSDKDEDNGIFYLNPANNSTKRIMSLAKNESALPIDISSTRKLALIRKYEEGNNASDLWVVGIFEKLELRLTNTSSEEIQAMFSPDSKSVSYISSRDARTDIYTIGVDGKSEKKVTTCGKVDDYFWGSNNLVFYNSEKSMWIGDASNGQKVQKVTDNVLGTYYSSHYYYPID